jgi:single-strand DNA-binding protein
MMKMNDVRVVGHLTKDPEVRYTPQGTPVTNVSLGVNDVIPGAEGEKKVISTFVNCEVWGAAAENLAKLVKKGQEIYVAGALRQNSWEDRETGKPRTQLFVKASEWQFTQYKAVDDLTKSLGPRKGEGVSR